MEVLANALPSESSAFANDGGMFQAHVVNDIPS